jgi:hypothetical protein
MEQGRRVALDDSGVPFTVESRASLAVRDVAREPALAHRFADRFHPLRQRSGKEPLCAVRLTRLSDGTLLNVCCTHACLDGNAFYTFVRNWSSTCAGRPFPVPVLDPSLVPAATTRSKAEVVRQAEAEGWKKVSAWTLARMTALYASGRLGGRFKVAGYPSEVLRRLRARAIRESAEPGIRTFEALSAHLTRMCARLVGLPETARVSQVTVLDARRHVASLPAEYAANAAFTPTCGEFAAGAPLAEAACAIHRGVAPFMAVPSARLDSYLSMARDMVRHNAAVMPYDVAAMHAATPTLTYVNNFWALPTYDVDFGEGGPVLAIPHDLPDPVVLWPAPPEQGGGVEVYFSGTYARAVKRLSSDDPWWAQLRLVD